MKPAMEASVRMTVSSPVLRELPIQSAVRNQRKTSGAPGAEGRATLSGMPRPQGAVHSGVIATAGSGSAGARL